MSSRLDRVIREVLTEGTSTLLEADMSRRLDMLVRQGLMPASQLQILKRGLEKFNQGKVPAPNERNAVNTLLNGMMFIVLGDDTVFNRARTSVQKNRYQTEEFDDLEEKMTVDIDHSGEKDDAAKKHGITLKRTGPTTANATGKRKNLKKYLTHHHGGDKKDAADVHKSVFKEEQIAMRMAIEEDKDWPRPFTKAERSEFMRPKEKSAEETKAIKDRMKAKNKLRPKGVQEGALADDSDDEHDHQKHAVDQNPKGHKHNMSNASHVAHLEKHLKKKGIHVSGDVENEAGGTNPKHDYITLAHMGRKSGDATHHVTISKGKAEVVHSDSYETKGHTKYDGVHHIDNLHKLIKKHEHHLKETKEEQLDEYGAMSSDKASHDTGGFRISNKDAAAAKERAKKKSAEKRDKLSNIIKKNTIQKGKFKGYMTDEVNQGEEKMEIDWTKNPFAQAKAMKEGAFKRMATDDAEEQRLKDQKKAKRLSAKKEKEEKETDPGLKEGLLQEGVAKNTLDIYQAAKDAKDKKSLKSMERQMDKAVNKANAKLKEELEGLPELDAMDYEMWEAYQSPTKNNYTDKELRQAKGIAFDKRYKGGNMTGAAKAMEKIKKGLSDHPVASKALRQANEEYMRESYLDQFDGVESMQDVFEMSYKEKFEAMLKKTGKKLSDMSDEEKKKFFNKVDDTHDAVNENKAFRDAARDYAKDDKKGLAPVKKDAPKVSDAKNAKEIEHIVPQMRKAISVGKKVQFKDGKHHTVSKAHAAKFLNKYMSGKPADKEKMQSHAHQSHKHFMDHAK